MRKEKLEYFIDKIYLTDDGLVVTSWYSEDRTEVTWDMLYGEAATLLLKGKPASSIASPLAPPQQYNPNPVPIGGGIGFLFYL